VSYIAFVAATAGIFLFFLGAPSLLTVSPGPPTSVTPRLIASIRLSTFGVMAPEVLQHYVMVDLYHNLYSNKLNIYKVGTRDTTGSSLLNLFNAGTFKNASRSDSDRGKDNKNGL
jgi:hypothetical protein